MAGTQEEEDHLHKCSCVAAFIAQDPDGELFTFRKFARLGARNLLRLQRDIQRLERKTDDFARRSCARRDVDHRTPLSNPDASRPNLDGRGDSQDQTNVELELQRKLEQYQDKALLLQKNILHMGKPSTRVLKAFRSQFCDPVPGSSELEFLQDEEDLIALRPPTSKDPLSCFLQNNWVPFGQLLHDPEDDKAVVRYSERDIERVVATVSGLAVSALLVCAIVSLNYAKKPGLRLGLIAIFMVVFSVTTGCFTNASRAEVYAASAAYGAVLVVFVSGNFGH